MNLLAANWSLHSAVHQLLEEQCVLGGVKKIGKDLRLQRKRENRKGVFVWVCMTVNVCTSFLMCVWSAALCGLQLW